MKIQLLVTTMFQKDFSKLEQMNVTGDVLFVNQDDRFEYTRTEHNNGRTAEMITTPTRGTSKNRNTAIEFCDKTCDYVLFMDDDILLNDDYEECVIKELTAHPEAKVVKFSIHSLTPTTRTTANKQTERFVKATRRMLSSCGGCALAIRRDVFDIPNMRFNEHFDPGGVVYCGGDTIFYQELVNKGVSVYLSPVDIAGVDLSDSSWFEGYNEKYINSAAQCVAHVYPNLSKLLAIRSAYRLSKNPQCNMKYFDILKCYYGGIKEYNKKRKELR